MLKSASLSMKNNKPQDNHPSFDKTPDVQEEKDFIKIDIEDSSMQEVSQASTQAGESFLPSQELFDVEVVIPPGPVAQETPNISSRSLENNSTNTNSVIESAKQACFLRKVCAVLLSMIMFTIAVLNETDLTSRLEILSVILSCCLMYITFENLVFCLAHDLAIDDYKERLFDVLDGLLAIYFMFVIKFRGEEKTSSYLLMASPCLYLVLTSIYVRQSAISSAKKILKIFIRLCCTIQAALIAAKILGYIELHWMIIFVPLGLCLAGYQIYGFCTLLKSLMEVYRGYRNDNGIRGVSLVKIFVQISWYTFYYGLSSLVLVILVNICKQMDRREAFESMTLLFRITKYCSFFLGYTLIFSKLMKKFNINESLENIVLEAPVLSKGYTLVPQKASLSSSFVKLSPTYFVKKSQETLNKSENKTLEKTLCYVCEINKPDVILMGCGHGGMCKDCVLLSMKKNSNCMECRRPVQSIYQIMKEDKNEMIVEAVETYTIIY